MATPFNECHVPHAALSRGRAVSAHTLIGLVFRLSLSSNTTVAIYCLVPLVIAEVCEVRDAASLNRATSLAAAAIAIVALSIAPAIAYFGPHTLAPRQKLAAMVTALWHDKTKTRLSLVAGTRLYADEIAFYSSDNPSEFIGFSFEFAPWVSPAAIANNGFIAVCKGGDTQCIENASRFAGGGALPQRVNLPGTKEYFSVMSIVPAKGQ